MAADHRVSANTSTVNCSTFNGGVDAGDTLTMDAGKRGPITFRDCVGSAGKPVTIRNDTSASGPTIIEKTSTTSGGFVFRCNNCKHVAIDGTGKWAGAPAGRCGVEGTKERRQHCGIVVRQVSDVSPSVYVMHDGTSTKFSVRGIEIDGRTGKAGNGGIGFHVRDQDRLRSDHPDEWREDILYENNYVHDIGGSGHYIGPNWVTGEVPLRNIEIRNSLVENVGRRGISIKSAIEGTNVVHHNRVYNTGLEAVQSGFGHGIMIFESGGTVSHNYVEAAGETGIECFSQHVPSSYGPFPCEVFNNVVVEPGATGPLSGNGINAGRKDSAYAEFIPSFFNNTVIRPESKGISVNSQITTRGEIRNNIVADADGSTITAPDKIAMSDNRIGSAAAMRFVNRSALDFRLAETSPARDAGTSVLFPSDDFNGVPRPVAGTPDQGAFEYAGGGLANKEPNPPRVK